MRKSATALFSILVVFALCVTDAGGQASKARLEQTDFPEDQDFEHLVSLPKPILDILAKGDRVADCLKYDRSAKASDASWFEASVATLGKDGSTGYVVKSKRSCLDAADATWYWVFRHTDAGYEMAVSNAGNELNLLNSYTAGYRDISVYRATAAEQATTTYKFNGTAYRIAANKREPIRR